jgi:ribosome maturation factor RimP
VEVDIDDIFSFSESLQRIFDEVDPVEFVRGGSGISFGKF